MKSKATLSLGLLSSALFAEIKTTTEQQIFGSGFTFKDIQAPATNDFGTKATWKIISGKIDQNSGGIAALHDGKVPSSDDAPRENFFFAAGSNGGLVHVDLS